MTTETKEFKDGDIWWLQKQIWGATFKYHFFEFVCVLAVYGLPLISFGLSLWFYFSCLVVSSAGLNYVFTTLISWNLSFFSVITKSSHFLLIERIIIYPFNFFTFLLFSTCLFILIIAFTYLLYKTFRKLDFNTINGQDLHYILSKATPHQIRFLKAVDQKTSVFKHKTMFDLSISEIFFNSDFIKIFVDTPEPKVDPKVLAKAKAVAELRKKNLSELIFIKEQEDLSKVSSKNLKNSEKKIL